jgi:cis-L-3-hydroxyproline dehydratase
MQAHSEGTEAAMRILGPRLLGEDPRQLGRIEYLLDNTVKGHGYAKAAVDAACWDILGKASGQPVWILLGGKHQDSAPLYRPAPQLPPAEMQAEMQWLRDAGYRQFQVKVGADWRSDIDRIANVVKQLQPGEKAFADANQGWHLDEALRVVRATRELDYVLEQPCMSYAECLHIRRHTDLPMKLDECITGLDMAQRAVADHAAEIMCLKISNLGGLSKARVVRDFLVANRISVVCEDTWGGEITTATLAHLAISTPAEFLVNTTDLHSYNAETTGTPAPRTEAGRLFASGLPGLGVEPDYNSLGDPVAVYV